MARIANSLAVLRGQVDAAYPNRSKSSDGWLGDAAHQARKSDHNPNSAGVVQALDITHDPKHGLDAGKLADQLRASRDARIKYIISNRRIASSYKTNGTMPWEWRPYSGPNAHNKHCHVSVVDDAAKYDNEAPWVLTVPVTTVPAKPPKSTPDQRRRMAKAIIKWEARRDRNGNLSVYKLPANDGGGTYEVAGINDRYHPEQAAKLKRLIEAGKYAEAEREVEDYVLSYTNVVMQWTAEPGVEFYLRDCAFNRGPTGAAKILQRALGVEDDGAVGPETRAALAGASAEKVLANLRTAREAYERDVAGYRANLWRGLVNRWNAQLETAREFQAEKPPTQIQKNIGTGGGIAMLVGGALQWLGAHPVISVLIALGIGAAVVAAIEIFKRKG